MKIFIPLGLAAAILSAGCGQRDGQEQDTASTNPAAEAPVPAPSAVTPPASPGATVQLAPTQGHEANGTLSLALEGVSVRLKGNLQGLAPNGQFGFHIHENGDCSAPDASSAGEHFNPGNAPHGNPQGGTHHAGDMLNVISDAEGSAAVDARAQGVTLGDGQANDVIGRAIVLHEKADDYSTQPSGDSGARIACGVITAG
jgi:Cu-Zn family superoxide dismutase